MGKVTIYRFKLYDITIDESRVSRRMGTREGIKGIGGEVIEETAVEVDASVVGQEVEGLTERNFNPTRRAGFQTQVTG